MTSYDPREMYITMTPEQMDLSKGIWDEVGKMLGRYDKPADETDEPEVT